jgi:hypothetical protein
MNDAQLSNVSGYFFQFESAFKEYFRMSVSVFRKSQNVLAKEYN